MKTKHIVCSLLVAAAMFTLPISQASNEVPKAILEICNEIAQDQIPDADPNCKGQCVAALHVCTDEKTGEFIFPLTLQCERKIEKLVKACAF